MTSARDSHSPRRHYRPRWLIAGMALGLAVFSCVPLPVLPPVRFAGLDAFWLQEQESASAGAYLSSLAAAGRGDYQSAADFLNHDALTPRPELYEQRFTYHLAAGDMAEALKLAPHLPRRGNSRGSVGDAYQQGQMLLGIEELRQNNPQSAYARWRELAQEEEFPAFTIAAAWAAQAHEQNSRPDAGISLDLPFEQMRRFHSALIADWQNAPETETLYREALQSGSARPYGRVVFAYALFLERTGRKEDAEKLYQLLGEGPGFENLAGRAASAESRKGSAMPSHLVASPLAGLAEFLQHMGLIAFVAEDYEIAILALRLAIYAYPEAAQARLYLSQLLDERGQHGAAMAVVEKIPASDFYYAPAQQHIVSLLKSSGEEEKALAQLEKLTAILPHHAGTFIVLGDFYRDNQNFEQAANAYGKAEELSFSPDWTVLYMLGISLERAGRWPEAEKHLRAAMKFSNGNPLVQNYLAYSWVEQKRNLRQAVELLESAVRKSPQSGFIIDSLGWAYYQMGQYAHALYYLERAAELSPDEAIINDHLGDALWRSGRHIEARFQWQRALDSNPEEQTRIAALKRKLLSGLDAAEEAAASAEVES